MNESRVPLQGAYTMSAIREMVGSWRLTHQTVALVPTMGNLHKGHLSLMVDARSRADRVVCSIFVNPAQFGPEEDFSLYPRTLAEDEALLAEQGIVDLVFAPEERDVYPFGAENMVGVTMPELSSQLCGASRPGHFDGVASVVLRLINMISPDVLILGEKDYQQFVLLKRMIKDLQLPIQVVSAPIQREKDGLAMSTRNQYLTADERRVAPKLHAELERVRNLLREGDQDYRAVEAQASLALETAGFDPDYVEVRRAADLSKPNGMESCEGLIIVAAAWLGRARLIDNVRV
ncbi:MAG: pantoate--beta-alanine ligase [Pseudomonadota bacterium]|nr:pantoate--beta-alanine ligase [Pseudomonadota bacterium]